MVRGVRFPASRVLLAAIFVILSGSPWGTAATAQDAKLVIYAAASLKRRSMNMATPDTLRYTGFLFPTDLVRSPPSGSAR